MSSILELPNGKIVNLDRFIALLPNKDRFSLVLEGYPQAIDIDQTEADAIKRKLNLASYNHNGNWDREEQIRKNQPKLKLLREWMDKRQQEAHSAEKEAEFEDFKRIIDAERPVGQKLYEE